MGNLYCATAANAFPTFAKARPCCHLPTNPSSNGEVAVYPPSVAALGIEISSRYSAPRIPFRQFIWARFNANRSTTFRGEGPYFAFLRRKRSSALGSL